MKTLFPLSLRCAHALLFLTGVPCCLAAAATSVPVAGEPLVFAEVNGLVAFEAEHFFRQELAERRAWHMVSTARSPGITPDADPAHHEGASGGAYIEALPDTRATHDDPLVRGENFSNEPGLMAVVSYRIHVTTPGRYHVWARVYSTGTEDNGVHFGLDGAWPESGRRWQTTKKDAWSWDSRQRTEQVHTGVPGQLFLDIATPGEHVLQISMREDGFEIDRILLTKAPAYVPEGTGPPARIHRGNLPPPTGAATRALEITDNGTPALTAYQRIICEIR